MPTGGEYHDCYFSEKITKLPENLTQLVIDNCKNFINLDNDEFNKILWETKEMADYQIEFLMQELSSYINKKEEIIGQPISIFYTYEDNKIEKHRRFEKYVISKSSP